MNTMSSLAVAVVAVLSLAGCASTQVAGLARADAAQAPVAGQKVSRALPSYGSMGGYRYRRFAAVVAAG